MRSPEETIARLEREKVELIAILRETRTQLNSILVTQGENVPLTPVHFSGLYRIGNHQPQNVYRGDQYIGVMFSSEDAASVVQMLNLHECPACPPSCGSCSHDPDCECYQHQNSHRGNCRDRRNDVAHVCNDCMDTPVPNRDDTLLASLRQQYDNDSALLEHMDREHSKLRAEHEELEAEYDATSKQLGKVLVDLAVSEAKVEQLRDQLVVPDPNHACAAHDDAHLGQPCPDRTATRPKSIEDGAA